MKKSYLLKPTMLVMALAAVYPLQTKAAASAGVAQFIAGDVNVRRPDGRTDPLLKGKDIESGQAILTGPSGRAQVRFSDGGLISLQPNTEFKITNYVDQADPKQDRFLVDLLHGSMRAITGLIGKRNRENYKVTTSTATIGIRGSGFNAGYNPDGSLSVTTEFDAIEVCNAGGCVGLTAGESVRVVSNQSAPARTNTRAPLPTPPPQQTPDIAGNQTTAEGTSAIVPPVVPKPAEVEVLVGLSLAGYGITGGAGNQGQIGNGALVLDSDGKPERFVGAPKPTIARDSGATTTVTSSTGSLGGNDLLLLGTWSAATLSNTEQGTAISPVAFVSGVPTSGAGLASLAGQRGEYRLSQASPVISNSGARGELLSSSKVSVDFFGVGSYADVDLNVRMSGSAAADYNLRGGAKGNGAGFEGVLSVSSPACIDGTVSCGRSASLSPNIRFTNSNNVLAGYVNGFVSGPNAANIGLSYGAYGTPSGDFGGAATFGRNSIVKTPSNNSLTDLSTFLADGSRQFSGLLLSSNYSFTVTNSFNGEALTKITNAYFGNETVYLKTGQEGSFGAVGKISDPNFIGWGTWVKGSLTFNNTAPTPLESVHYLVGRPTPALQMPTSGMAAYTMIGGTVPTATLAATTINGTLLSANMSADFAFAKVNVNIAMQFAGTPVNINVGNTGFGPGYISGSTFSGCINNGTVNGMFSGDKAFRAGLVYSAANPTVGIVAGAIAFQRVSATGLTVGVR